VPVANTHLNLVSLAGLVAGKSYLITVSILFTSNQAAALDFYVSTTSASTTGNIGGSTVSCANNALAGQTWACLVTSWAGGTAYLNCYTTSAGTNSVRAASSALSLPNATSINAIQLN
jgi:hypothetical protein